MRFRAFSIRVRLEQDFPYLDQCVDAFDLEGHQGDLDYGQFLLVGGLQFLDVFQLEFSAALVIVRVGGVRLRMYINWYHYHKVIMSLKHE